MKKSLNINATRAGKKVSKSLGYVNPDVANSIVGGFAQMVNALSNDTFVNAEVVKKMDTTEEEQQGGGATPTVTLHVDDSDVDNGSSKLEYKGYATIEGGVRFTFMDHATGTENLWLDVTYTVE